MEHGPRVTRLIADTMTRGADEVVIVTSKPYSRRVRVTWRAAVRSAPEAVVRYADSVIFDAAHWWHRASDARKSRVRCSASL
jgi:hypothetical protein